MEGGEITAPGSPRHGRSNSASKAFSRSSWALEKEEASKWAAVEKLPTSSRVRKSILHVEEGEPIEVDQQNLSAEERKLVLQIASDLADDNEKFLRKLKDRMSRVGIESPTIEVRYEDLNVGTEALVVNSGVPSTINFFTNYIQALLNALRILTSKKRPYIILRDLSGIIKPSRLTLLLGPPGSGKTTLLKALAGKLDSNLKVKGEVAYNGHGLREFVPQRTSAYIGQNDVHLGQLTVRETLQFSARCQGSGSPYDMLMELLRREKQENIKPDPDIDLFMKASALIGQHEVFTEYILKVLGLETCGDTLVGDRMVRGISGGERRRVTTGEMIVGPAKALFMDEISTGLDSSTTFQIVNAIRQSVHVMNNTAVIALLQPAPETFALFDDVILLSEGQIVYQGPRDCAVNFFESLGLKCPERKGVADFLQEVISWKDQQQYWEREDEPYRFISVKEFSERFKNYHLGRSLSEELRIPFDKQKSQPSALSSSAYGVGKLELLKACAWRELVLMRRSSSVYIFRLSQLLVLGIVAATLFLRTNLRKDNVEDGVVILGALYFGLVTHFYNGFAELVMSISILPIFYKQRDSHFYPSWVFAIPSWVLKIPISMVECALWTALTYYAIGFDPNIQRMLRHYLLLVLLSQMAFGIFRFIAALGRNMVLANTIGAFGELILMALGGFILSRVDVKEWWIWAYWSSPIMYAYNAITVNEFLGHSWNKVGDVRISTDTLGVQVLKLRGLFAEASWYWIGVGALLGYICLLNGLFSLALTYLNPFNSGQMVLSGEISSEKEHSSIRSSVDLPTLSKKKIRQVYLNGNKGMVLPFKPYSIIFENIKYSVDMPPAKDMKEEKLVLLNGLNGAFRPGVLTALMGVSGAGKTTLLDVLAGRKTGGYIEGDIKISGFPKKQETFARISGYCEQNDIHSPHVTVYESLLFSAWLRLPSEVNAATRKMFVEEVMELVELTSLGGAIVGLPGVNGLSTEQRKRLTIAVELVANPSIIFMDEPTTGLDARAAAIVMRAVRNTVDKGKTVVCTIHQPGVDIFEAFDELFLMKRGGEEIYVGPLGRQSSHLISYFEGISGVKNIPDGQNPAAWMLEITGKEEEEKLGINFSEIYKKSELYRRNKEMIKQLSEPAPEAEDLHFTARYFPLFFKQCAVCLWKQNKSYWRNTHYTAVRIFFSTVSALLFGAIFWRLGQTRSVRQDLFNAMGSLYASVLLIGIQNSLMVQPEVEIERTVFYREKAAGMYSALPYVFGQVVIEIPYIFLQSLLCGFIIYSMIDFQWTATKFFWFIIFFFTMLLYFTYFGMMAVGLSRNSEIAVIFSSAIYTLWNIFSGFIISKKMIPIWWRWYYWACPTSYTLYGLIASQFGDYDDIVEDTGERVKDFVRRYFGYREGFIGAAAVATIGFSVLFALIFAYGIKFLKFHKR